MFQIIGHRGYGPTHELESSDAIRQDFPENSIAAFGRALKRGVEGVEVDVLVTADGIAVALHGNDVWEYVFDELRDDRPLDTYKYAEVRQWDIGGGHHIPKIQEVIDFTLAANPDALINLDIKSAGAVIPLMAAIVHSDASPDQVLLTSYNWDALRHARKISDEIRIAAGLKTVRLFGAENVSMPDYLPLVEELHPDILDEIEAFHEEVGLDAIDCTIPDLRTPLIEFAAEHGIGVAVSTGDSRVTAAELNPTKLVALIQRSDLPFFVLKADEPRKTQRRLAQLILDASVDHRPDASL